MPQPPQLSQAAGIRDSGGVVEQDVISVGSLGQLTSSCSALLMLQALSKPIHLAGCPLARCRNQASTSVLEESIFMCMPDTVSRVDPRNEWTRHVTYACANSCVSRSKTLKPCGLGNENLDARPTVWPPESPLGRWTRAGLVLIGCWGSGSL